MNTDITILQHRYYDLLAVILGYLLLRYLGGDDVMAR